MRTVVIIGGGFTGAATAIHLARSALTPLEIAVLEPRAEVGRGVAYSASDPDHRLNAPAAMHVLFPEDSFAFENWLGRTGGFEDDPEMEALGGGFYPRRGVFGAFVNAQFSAHAKHNPSRSRIKHIRATALDISPVGTQSNVHLACGSSIAADLVVLTTSNEQPAIPHPFSSEDVARPHFIANPWDLTALSNLDAGARLLIVGSGLTAADVIATALREKPQTGITVLSRSGLRPASRADSPPTRDFPLWERLNAKPSLFEARHGALRSVRAVLKALRADIATFADNGQPWQSAFDDLRDSVRGVWMALPADEKRRFQRHLRRRYDSHRFRYPPHTHAKLKLAEAAGRLSFWRASIERVVAQERGFEVTWLDPESGCQHVDVFAGVVNCTGPASRPENSTNLLLQRIVQAGTARTSPIGVGIDVDHNCRVLNANGEVQANLYAYGPLTYATFGYPQGSPFIVDQILRAMPMMLDVDASHAS
jgi:uncharacterized NAD(P)/FAD-binding protein YdhS